MSNTAGILRFAGASELPSTTSVSISGGTFDLDSSVAMTIASLSGTAGGIDISTGSALSAGNGSNTTLASQLSGAGTFTKIGTGTMTLTNISNDLTGTLTVSAGTLAVANQALPGDVVDNATVSFNQGETDASYGGLISGTGILNVSGTTTLTLSGLNTYSGATNIESGSTLVVGADNVVPSTSAVTDDGTFTVSNNDTISSLSGGGLFTVVSGKTLTVDGTTTDTFSGTSSGAGSFAKVGTGITIFNGANAYTGTTSISDGTLRIANNGDLR